MQTERFASVLLVDDRPEKLLAIESLLSDMRLEIVRATSGREALRHLLQRDFALILLDVNMPDMDGLETAALIRGRKSSEHIPIIFITAYGDDIFMERGYSLGAVDYILQPVVPDILRTKVGVFVELYEKTNEIRRQAEIHSRRASQLQRLAQVSMSINAASSIDRILELATQAARGLIGAASATTAVTPADGAAPHFAHDCDLEDDLCLRSAHALTPVQRDAIRAYLRHHKSLRVPPHNERTAEWGIRPDEEAFTAGLLAAPLATSDGNVIGFVAVLDKTIGTFAEEDEAILLLLTQMASIAIENMLSAEARAANKAKDEFLAVLSHELRTPLTPVLPVLSHLISDERIHAEARADLEMIQRNVKLEARLIDDLLDLTRISKGKVELQCETIDLHSLVREAMKICQVEADEKALRVNIHLRAANARVRGDHTRVLQILWNLLKNAIKFTDRGGSVEVTSENDGDEQLTIRVVDTGLGIEPEFLPRIFNAFEQGPRSTTRQFGGLGLGLTITKALVEAHRGVISAMSQGRNKGATFTLTLPLDDVSQAVARPLQSVSPSSSAVRSLKILLVEDHPDTGRIMRRLLAAETHEVSLAQTVAEAVHVYDSDTFDLVISDVGLPDGSGLDLIQRIQARKPVLAIALSGFGMEEDVRRSHAAGFHEHLTKPIDFSKLLECVNRIFRTAPPITAVEPARVPV